MDNLQLGNYNLIYYLGALLRRANENTFQFSRSTVLELLAKTLYGRYVASA